MWQTTEANSQQETKALSPPTYKELNPAQSHINELRNEPSDETLAPANYFFMKDL